MMLEILLLLLLIVVIYMADKLRVITTVLNRRKGR